MFLRCSVLIFVLAASCKGEILSRRTAGSATSSEETKKTCTKLVNAKETTEYPSVVFIKQFLSNSSFYCSGIWVGHNVLLTSWGCIDTDLKPEVTIAVTGESIDVTELETYKSVKAIKVLQNGVVGKQDSVNDKKELQGLGIAIFPDNTAPAITEIYQEHPADNSQVTLIGFGNPNAPGEPRTGDSAVFVKRIGTNKLIQANQINFNGMQGIFGVLGNPKQNSDGSTANTISGENDDGAAMLLDGKLVGLSALTVTADGGDPLMSAGTLYIALESSASKALIEEAKKQGAVFGNPPKEEEKGEKDPKPTESEEKKGEDNTSECP
ncbi:MAG: hypothetical protein AB7T49_14265 [Oligoflexales bacterium]